jgi:hypothetical protein
VKLSHVTEFYVIGHMAGDLRWPDTGQKAYFDEKSVSEAKEKASPEEIFAGLH